MSNIQDWRMNFTVRVDRRPRTFPIFLRCSLKSYGEAIDDVKYGKGRLVGASSKSGAKLGGGGREPGGIRTRDALIKSQVLFL